MSGDESRDVVNYLANFFPESDSEITKLHRILDLDSCEFDTGSCTHTPSLAGFRKDPASEFGRQNVHYLQAIEDGNVHEIDVGLLEYLSIGGLIELGDHKLELESSILEVIPEGLLTWMPAVLRVLANNGKSFFNSSKVAIRSLKRSGDFYSAELGETSYFTTSLTNDLFAKRLVWRDAPQKYVATFSTAYPAHRKNLENWELLDYRKCRGVSNHAGSAVLAITSDFRPIIQQQGVNAQHHTGKKHVSGAGSLELSDLDYVVRRDNQSSLNDFVKFGMARELLEETGSVPQGFDSPKTMEEVYNFSQRNVLLLTVARDVQRGGLPIFLGFAHIDRTIDEIINQRSVETTVDPGITTQIRSSSELLAFLESYCHGQNSSDQLLLYKSLLQFHPVRDRFEQLLTLVRQPL